MKNAASDPAIERFHKSAGARFMLLTLLLLMAALEIFIAGIAIATIASELSIAIVLGVTCAAMFPLTLLIFFETKAAFGLRIEISSDGVSLRLPARRGHVIHSAVSRIIPLSDIAGVETRAEAFSQIGVVAVQQSYRLALRSGEVIELGADRQFQETVIGDAAQHVAKRINLAIRDRGMIDGDPGFLAAAGTSVPDWSAAPLSEAERASRHTAAANALKAINLSLLVVLIARLIARR